MPLPKVARVIASIIFITVVASAIHFLAAEPSSGALTKTYSNAAWGFMLKRPADFAAYPPNATPNRDETGAPTGQALLLQNKSGAIVQIEITPDTRAEPGTNLTVDDIAQSASYFDLSKATSIEIAPDVIGVLFIDAEHPNFGSSTEHVWFTYRGNLYQDGRREIRCTTQVDARHVDVHLRVCAERVTSHVPSQFM